MMGPSTVVASLVLAVLTLHGGAAQYMRHPYSQQSNFGPPYSVQGGGQGPYIRQGRPQDPYNLQRGGQSPYRQQSSPQGPYNPHGGGRIPYGQPRGPQGPFNLLGSSQGPYRQPHTPNHHGGNSAGYRNNLYSQNQQPYHTNNVPGDGTYRNNRNTGLARAGHYGYSQPRSNPYNQQVHRRRSNSPRPSLRPSRPFSLRPRRPNPARNNHRPNPWYRKPFNYRSFQKPRRKNGYYQNDYDFGKDSFYDNSYPTIPTYDQKYSQDTSDFYSHRTFKVACYQCNYKPGKTYWDVVTRPKSVPDPYYPYRRMTIRVREYVRRQGAVTAGWDKCQGSIDPYRAKMLGIYNEPTCEGNCYVRTDKNGMVYRGCYAGEWGVNPNIFGCSYQAGSLYCFCRGDSCNGFLAPASYSEPYPHDYGSRSSYPYPADYPSDGGYNPYPSLRTYHQSHPVRSHQRHGPGVRRYRRAVSAEDAVEEDDDSIALYNRLAGVDTASNEIQRNESTIKRSCYTCEGDSCAAKFTNKEAAGRGITSDVKCYGNCYVRLDTPKDVARGCYGGEEGVNQHLIGCHVQGNVTYCFCRGGHCNQFAVTVEEPEEEATTEKDEKTIPNTEDTEPSDNSSENEKPDYPMVVYYIEFPES